MNTTNHSSQARDLTCGEAGRIVIRIGAQVDDRFSGYTVAARMPDGGLVFRGPYFIEGEGQNTGSVKLKALDRFLESSKELCRRYGGGLRVEFQSGEDALADTWDRCYCRGEGFRNAENRRLWNGIVSHLRENGLTMAVRGKE